MTQSEVSKSSNITRLGDLTPQFETVELMRNDEIVVLKAYILGKRCPGSIKSRLAQAFEIYNREATNTDGKFVGNTSAFIDYIKEALLITVIGLENQEADVLSGDSDSSLALLTKLGVWNVDNKEEKAVGEAERK